MRVETRKWVIDGGGGVLRFVWGRWRGRRDALIARKSIDSHSTTLSRSSTESHSNTSRHSVNLHNHHVMRCQRLMLGCQCQQTYHIPQQQQPPPHNTHKTLLHRPSLLFPPPPPRYYPTPPATRSVLLLRFIFAQLPSLHNFTLHRLRFS